MRCLSTAGETSESVILKDRYAHFYSTPHAVQSVVCDAALDLDLKEGGSRFPVTRAYGTVRKTKVHLIRTNGKGSSVTSLDTLDLTKQQWQLLISAKARNSTHTCRFQPCQGSHFKCTALYKYFAQKLTVTQLVKKIRLYGT
jgi:hypothetical protein